MVLVCVYDIFPFKDMYDSSAHFSGRDQVTSITDEPEGKAFSYSCMQMRL